MDPTTTIERNGEHLSTPVDDDLVILNLPRDVYIALDPIGRRIWEMLDAPLTVAELCARLVQEFDSTAEQITTDVLAFLGEMAEEELIRVAGN